MSFLSSILVSNELTLKVKHKANVTLIIKLHTLMNYGTTNGLTYSQMTIYSARSTGPQSSHCG